MKRIIIWAVILLVAVWVLGQVPREFRLAREHERGATDKPESNIEPVSEENAAFLRNVAEDQEARKKAEAIEMGKRWAKEGVGGTPAPAEQKD